MKWRRIANATSPGRPQRSPSIWYSLVAMPVAGAVCGATIGWSYGRLFEPSIRSWLGYNASYVIALAVLGVMSVAVFEPRITMAELLTTD